VRKSIHKSSNQPTNSFGSLFDQTPDFPAHSKFPINFRRDSLKVGLFIENDLKESAEPWIITGFSSLGYLVEFLGSREGWDNRKKIRIAFGFKLKNQLSKPKELDLPTFEEEVALLEEGFSTKNWSNLFRLIQLLDDKTVEIRFLDRLHAKIYVGDNYATLGSSNFSKSGLTQQPEANIRVSNNDDPLEKEQYKAFSQLASFFFYEGKPCNQLLSDLLKQQLVLTEWKETLARAIAELLERPWYNDVAELKTFLNGLLLWPTQQEGINQALNTLQKHHCVLIADPTGSGKTKLVTTLTLILTHWLWKKGHMFKSRIETICPKLVVKNWQDEADELRFVPRHAFSDGAISSGTEENKQKTIERLRKANILVIDEAHRFLNPDTNRTKQLRKHRADYLILSTATPLSKKPKDLVRIVEILGIDVLPDEQQKAFQRLRMSLDSYDENDLILLRDYLKHLIVRRTKKQINRYLDLHPVAHKSIPNKNCKYPKQVDEPYATNCRQSDIKKAEKILKYAQDLKGLVFLQKLFKKKYREKDQTDEQYIANRIGSAKAIAKYKIRALLRSSRAAVIEHIAGTEAAEKALNFKCLKKNVTGNMQQTLQEMKGKLPEHNVKSKALEQYSWLNNIDSYREAIEAEIKIYGNIKELASKMSDDREKSKADILIMALKEHSHILAFDSTLITLDFLQNKYFSSWNNEFTCYLPRDKPSQLHLITEFGFNGSPLGKHLGLLSDAMSEGINLPKGEVVAMLDMPSVLRLAEQRIGRIDRLNSPHESIKVLWPQDRLPFTLKKDVRLFKANNAARFIYGSNITVPEELLYDDITDNETEVNGDEFINSYRQHEESETSAEASFDAFQPVRQLFSEESGVITPSEYDKMKAHQTRVHTKLSISEDEEGWLFVALKSTKDLPPRWYLLKDSSTGYRIETAIDLISNFLNEKLQIIRTWYTKDKWKPEWWEVVQPKVNQYLDLMQVHQLQHLPPQKRRALIKAHELLNYISKNSKLTEEHKALAEELLQQTPDPRGNKNLNIDPYLCAEQWLDFFKPSLNELQDRLEERNPKSNKLLSIADIKAKDVDLSVSQIITFMDNIPNQSAQWDQVVACILAVPNGIMH